MSDHQDIVRVLREFCEMGLEGGNTDPLIEVMHGVAAQAANEIERLRDDPSLLPLEAMPDGYWFHRLIHAPDHVSPDRRWEVALQNRRDRKDFTILWGFGPTPRAAVLNAVGRIGP